VAVAHRERDVDQAYRHAARLASDARVAQIQSSVGARDQPGVKAPVVRESIYDARSAAAVRSDATRSSWLSKLH
jgi:hypothetical protein